jgi:bifunctional UDP-N-acetylglucosamine pyrophosphorylase / glucosamine-1-phosphate N-acetyltransferase
MPSGGVCAIILAAGEGSRMKSELPKPLHEVCGTSMLLHVVHSLESIPLVATVVVVGHRAPEVTAHIQQNAPDWARIQFATQHEQNGTGDAAAAGLQRSVQTLLLYW